MPEVPNPTVYKLTCPECGRPGCDCRLCGGRGFAFLVPLSKEPAHHPLPFTSTHRAVASCREILREARRDLKEAPVNSVAFGNADGRIEAAHYVLDQLGEHE